MVKRVIQVTGARNHEKLFSGKRPGDFPPEHGGVLHKAQCPQDSSENADLHERVVESHKSELADISAAFGVSRPGHRGGTLLRRNRCTIHPDVGIRAGLWIKLRRRAELAGVKVEIDNGDAPAGWSR